MTTLDGLGDVLLRKYQSWVEPMVAMHLSGHSPSQIASRLSKSILTAHGCNYSFWTGDVEVILRDLGYAVPVHVEPAPVILWRPEAAQIAAPRNTERPKTLPVVFRRVSPNYVEPSLERNKAIWRLRKDGITLKAVGEKFGMTRECIRQIVLREDRRRKHAQPRIENPPSRPIDMGGERDKWIEWTAEFNARELGLI